MNFLKMLSHPDEIASWLWLVEIVIGIIFLIIISLFLTKFVSRIRKKSTPQMSNWRTHIDQIVSTPLHIAIWTIGITFVLDILVIHFGLKVIPHYISVVRSAILVFCLSWVMIRWIKVSRHAFTEKSFAFGLDGGTIQAFAKISIFVISVLTCVILLQIFGLNVMPLLAFGGIGAAALGFAGKDVIANFFGGLMLHINRPFTSGENILMPTQNNLEGKVEEIGWYTTSIRDAEKRLVFLPNALFSSMLVINLSRMTHRRVIETLKIRTEDFSKLPRILQEIHNFVDTHPNIDHDIPIHVVFIGYGEDSLNVLIEFYLSETDYEIFLAQKQEILLELDQILKSCSAALRVPATFVHLVK